MVTWGLWRMPHGDMGTLGEAVVTQLSLAEQL